jgi:hypothetical protein
MKPKALSGSILKTPKEFDQVHVRKMIMSMLRMTKEDLANALRAPATSCLELSIGAMIVSSIRDADLHKLDFLLNRSIGKVKESLSIELPPSISYVVDVNNDGNLVRSVLTDDNSKEKNIIIDLKNIAGEKEDED